MVNRSSMRMEGRASQVTEAWSVLPAKDPHFLTLCAALVLCDPRLQCDCAIRSPVPLNNAQHLCVKQHLRLHHISTLAASKIISCSTPLYNRDCNSETAIVALVILHSDILLFRSENTSFSLFRLVLSRRVALRNYRCLSSLRHTCLLRKSPDHTKTTTRFLIIY